MGSTQRPAGKMSVYKDFSNAQKMGFSDGA
jgi:hypothetical protein